MKKDIKIGVVMTLDLTAIRPDGTTYRDIREDMYNIREKLLVYGNELLAGMHGDCADEEENLHEICIDFIPETKNESLAIAGIIKHAGELIEADPATTVRIDIVGSD
jgi:hypothetical protein